MSSWIIRSLAAIGAALTLTGCEEATGFPFAEMGDLGTESEHARTLKIAMGNGDIVLSAPDGYCIDRRSVRRVGDKGFAMIARCDTVGVRGYYEGYDLAVMTVTTARQAPGSPAPTLKDMSSIAQGARVLDKASRDGVVLVRLGTGSAALDGVSPVHWRGAFQLNDNLVGVSVYGPEGSGAVGRNGAALISDLAQRTRTASKRESLPKTAESGKTD